MTYSISQLSDHPEIIPLFSRLKQAKREGLNLVVGDGPKVVEKMISFGLKLKYLLCDQEFLNSNLSTLGQTNTVIIKCDRKDLKSIIGGHYHQGVIAAAECPKFLDLSYLTPPYFILNAVSSPENVGAIARSLRGFGIKSLIVDQNSCSPYLRRCIRVSMGNVFGLDIHLSSNLVQTINQLKMNGINIIACDNNSQSVSIHNWRPIKENALIIGSEGYGIEPRVFELADQTISIPIDSNVAHLNAAQAATIFSYEISKSLLY